MTFAEKVRLLSFRRRSAGRSAATDRGVRLSLMWAPRAS